MEQRRDPWAPFRFWVALTIALFAIRAVAVTAPFVWVRWLGSIPGWVLLLMVLLTLVLAAAALLFPARTIPFRDGEPGLWQDMLEDWRHRWHRRGGAR